MIADIGIIKKISGNKTIDFSIKKIHTSKDDKRT
jgi:hypothetical protein